MLGFQCGCEQLYIDIRNLMELPLATVHVNMGEHLPHPEIRIYPHTHIPHAIRKFMQRYGLPEPVFAVMLDQIQQALIAHGLFSQPLHSQTSKCAPTDSSSPSDFVTVDHNVRPHKPKNKRQNKAFKANPLYTPFYRLFVSDENDCPNVYTQRKQKKKIQNQSRLSMVKKPQPWVLGDREPSRKQNQKACKQGELSLR